MRLKSNVFSVRKTCLIAWIYCFLAHLPCGVAQAQNNNLVVGWGYGLTDGPSAPHFGQAIVPPKLGECKDVAGGRYFSLALTLDGTIYAWGNNPQGQCNIPAGIGACIRVAAGSESSLAITANGLVVAWGFNGMGQSTVPSNLGTCIDIAAGEYHSLALTTGGTVVGWGANWYG